MGGMIVRWESFFSYQVARIVFGSEVGDTMVIVNIVCLSHMIVATNKGLKRVRFEERI